MKWILAGGTGLIGTALCKRLIEQGDEVWVLSRNPEAARLPAGVHGVRWDGKTPAGWGHLVEQVDFIANLAGENLGAGRWTETRKRAFYASRINSGEAIVQAVSAARKRPRALLQASAVGYYGDSRDAILDEQTPPGEDFLAQLAVDWENSTRSVEEWGLRRVITRIGIVLASGGEVMNKFLLQYNLFAGGPLGSGDQWMPWIHLQDVVEAMIFLTQNEAANGACNLTGPNPVHNADFGRTLAKVLRRPYWFPVPGFALKLALGEMSCLVLEGQRALPVRLQALGYTFRYSELDGALREVVGGTKSIGG